MDLKANVQKTLLAMNGLLLIFLAFCTYYLSMDDRVMYATKLENVTNNKSYVFISSMSTAKKTSVLDFPGNSFDNPSNPCESLADTSWCKASFSSIVIYTFFGGLATFGSAVFLYTKKEAPINRKIVLGCYWIFMIFVILSYNAAEKFHQSILPNCKGECKSSRAAGTDGSILLFILMLSVVVMTFATTLHAMDHVFVGF